MLLARDSIVGIQYLVQSRYRQVSLLVSVRHWSKTPLSKNLLFLLCKRLRQRFGNLIRARGVFRPAMNAAKRLNHRFRFLSQTQSAHPLQVSVASAYHLQVFDDAVIRQFNHEFLRTYPFGIIGKRHDFPSLDILYFTLLHCDNFIKRNRVKLNKTLTKTRLILHLRLGSVYGIGNHGGVFHLVLAG